MKTLKEKIAVMQHAIDNSDDVEIRIRGSQKWVNIGVPSFNWDNHDYRIKPKWPAKYRVVPPKCLKNNRSWGVFYHLHVSAAIKQAKCMAQACHGHKVVVNNLSTNKAIYKVIIKPYLKLSEVLTNLHGGTIYSEKDI